MKKIVFLLVLLNYFLCYSQKAKILPQGVYKTYEDFISKKVTKYDKPFTMKIPYGAFYYSLKDSTRSTLKTPYFAIVQNDSILVRVKDIKERFKSNKNVIIKSREFDYNLALYNSKNEIYFEQLVGSKSMKYIGVGIGYFKGVIFNLDTQKSYILMKYNDVKSYLSSVGKLNLLEYIPEKKRINAIDIDKAIKKHFEIE